MTACNLRPPEGHPFHGTLVACHLAAHHIEPHSWEIRRPRHWCARLSGGPAAGPPDREFAVGPIWATIVVAKFESPARGEHWEIVGGDQMPIPDRIPWDDEATYTLAEIAEAFDPDRPYLAWMAFYRWARQ
jgi:hypothetical protein